MQITIDTIHDTPEQLRKAAKFLGELAGPADETVVVNVHPTMKIDGIHPDGVFSKEKIEATFNEISTRASDHSAPVPELAHAPEPFDAAQCEWVETAAEELDSDGQPWDAELHSAGKTKTADGKWRKRKGVNATPAPADEQAAQNRAENLGAMAAESGFATPPPPPPTSLFDAPAPAPTGAAVTFPELVQLVLKHKCAPADVLAACQAEGVAAMPMLAAQPDKVQAVAVRLGVV